MAHRVPDPAMISGEVVTTAATRPGAGPLAAPGDGVRRYLVLAASVVMLVFLGTGQAWSVFIAPLRSAFQFSDSHLQLVFTTSTTTFCVVFILGGRLHDRWS